MVSFSIHKMRTPVYLLQVRVEVEKLTNTTDSLMSKMEQVFAVVQGLDVGEVVKVDGKGT